MLPPEVLQTIAEHLRRVDLEALRLTNRHLLSFVEKRFDKFPRHLNIVVAGCDDVSVVALRSEKDGKNSAPLYMPLRELGPLLRHSVVDVADFHTLLCECVMEHVRPLLALLKYAYSVAWTFLGATQKFDNRNKGESHHSRGMDLNSYPPPLRPLFCQRSKLVLTRYPHQLYKGLLLLAGSTRFYCQVVMRHPRLLPKHYRPSFARNCVKRIAQGSCIGSVVDALSTGTLGLS